MAIFEDKSALSNDQPDADEQLSEIEKTRRDLMLARLESFKNTEEPSPSEPSEPVSAAPEPPVVEEAIDEILDEEPIESFSAVDEPPAVEEANDETIPMEPIEPASPLVAEHIQEIPADLHIHQANEQAHQTSIGPYNRYNQYNPTNDKLIDDIMFGIVNADIATHRRQLSQQT